MEFSDPDFPNSEKYPFKRTSDDTPIYNCIAWAAGRNDVWFEPDEDEDYFWPNDVPREYTIEAYIKLYEYYGYERCDDGTYEPGFQKVAVFADENCPTHAARQLNVVEWTSKMGRWIDVSHSIEGMQGGYYGNVIQFLKRKLES